MLRGKINYLMLLGNNLMHIKCNNGSFVLRRLLNDELQSLAMHAAIFESPQNQSESKLIFNRFGKWQCWLGFRSSALYKPSRGRRQCATRYIPKYNAPDFPPKDLILRQTAEAR